MKTLRDKCLDMWQWFIDHPYSGKIDWVLNHEDLAEGAGDGVCFACVAAVEGCSDCPVNWDGVDCEDTGSSYKVWQYDQSSENARKVYKVIEETWTV